LFKKTPIFGLLRKHDVTKKKIYFYFAFPFFSKPIRGGVFARFAVTINAGVFARSLVAANVDRSGAIAHRTLPRILFELVYQQTSRLEIEIRDVRDLRFRADVPTENDPSELCIVSGICWGRFVENAPALRTGWARFFASKLAPQRKHNVPSRDAFGQYNLCGFEFPLGQKCGHVVVCPILMRAARSLRYRVLNVHGFGALQPDVILIGAGHHRDPYFSLFVKKNKKKEKKVPSLAARGRTSRESTSLR
jgi:hypothetical protein